MYYFLPPFYQGVLTTNPPPFQLCAPFFAKTISHGAGALPVFKKNSSSNTNLHERFGKDSGKHNAFKTMKILVVHRQKKTVDLIKSVLSSCNPVVLHTESGLDGLLTSRIEHFDVIISGTDLPVVTGFELIRSVRTNSINRNTPVIFISDEVDEKTQHLGNALGVAAMLALKDVDIRLADIVSEQVKTEPDKKWSELLPSTRSN